MPRPALLALAWTLLALVALLMPGGLVPETSVLSMDKGVHVGLFALFGGLWLYAYPRAPARVFALGVAFGVFTEVLQGALPIGRSADPWDVAANVLGLGLGMGAAVLARRLRGGEKKRAPGNSRPRPGSPPYTAVRGRESSRPGRSHPVQR